MIAVERKLAGVIPYKVVYFPTDAALRSLIDELKPAEMARLFWGGVDLEGGSRVVRHHLTRTVCIDLHRPLDAIWKQMDSKGCRYEIRRADKLSDRIRIERNGVEAPQHFLRLFNAFARAKAEGVSAISCETIARFGPNIDFFLAYLDDQPLCGHVLLRDAGIGRARLLYSGSRRLEDPDSGRMCGGVNRLLHWHELQAYRLDGFRIFDFGGIDERAAPGIAGFKKSFGGKIVNEHTYLCAGTPWLGRIVQGVFENCSARGRGWRSRIARHSPAQANSG